MLLGTVSLGGLLVAAGLMCAQTWTQTTASNLDWYCVASSVDGSELVVASQNSLTPGEIYLSTNSGSSWNQATNGLPVSANWSSVASSADGTKVVVASANGSIFTSADSGNTWTNVNAPSESSWASIASSADGSTLVAIGYLTGRTYVSTNSGASWKLGTNAQAYGMYATCSADGTKMAVVGSYTPTRLFTSTNSGRTWQLSFSNSIGNNITDLASSPDGSKLFVFVYAPNFPTNFYISTNWGGSWSSNVLSIPDLGQLACSADGSRLVASASPSSGVFTSTDSGMTWVSNNVPNEGWGPVASSADGNKLVAIGFPGTSFGEIWTSHSVAKPQLNLASSRNGLALSWIVPSTNFVLQENSDLTTTNWLTLTNAPMLNLSNLNDEVVCSPSNSSGFFRLKAQ
jgi:photosystem II stability/assembly factor-like uncharacterized protein